MNTYGVHLELRGKALVGATTSRDTTGLSADTNTSLLSSFTDGVIIKSMDTIDEVSITDEPGNCDHSNQVSDVRMPLDTSTHHLPYIHNGSLVPTLPKLTSGRMQGHRTSAHDTSETDIQDKGTLGIHPLLPDIQAANSPRRRKLRFKALQDSEKRTHQGGKQTVNSGINTGRHSSTRNPYSKKVILPNILRSMSPTEVADGQKSALPDPDEQQDEPLSNAQELEMHLDQVIGQFDGTPEIKTNGRRCKKLGGILPEGVFESLLESQSPVRMESCYNYYL